MPVGQFHHDPPFGVAVERGQKRGEVAHVVEDMVAHDHGRVGGAGGDVRPAADDLRVPNPAPLGRFREHVEHGLALVDGDKQAGRRRQGEAGCPAACADVEHGPA